MEYQPAPGKPYKEPTITVKDQRFQVVDKVTYLGTTLYRVVHIDDEVMPGLPKLVQHLADYVEVFEIEVESDLKEAFMRTEQIMFLNRGRRGLWPRKIDLSPPVKYFSLTVPRRFFYHGLFCYSSSLNVCVAYIFLFWIAIWPLCVKVTVRLAFC